MDKSLLDRCMLLRIPETHILQSIVELSQNNIILRLELPEGYKISGVYYDNSTRDFIFKVHHEKFYPITQEMQIPYIGMDSLIIKAYEVKQVKHKHRFVIDVELETDYPMYKIDELMKSPPSAIQLSALFPFTATILKSNCKEYSSRQG